MPSTRDEQRMDVRIAFDQPVIIYVDGRKRGARAVDLSCGGARINYESSHVPVPSRAHRLRFARPDGESVEVVVMPVWRTRFSYGVRFLLADDMERLAIAELMDSAVRRAA